MAWDKQGTPPRSSICGLVPDPPAPQGLAWGCAFHSPHADFAKGKEITLRRRFAFEEDGEEPREAPRNGIDLDINPGRLPPAPSASRAAGPRSPLHGKRLASGAGGQPAPPGWRVWADSRTGARPARGAPRPRPRRPPLRHRSGRREHCSAAANRSPESGAPPHPLSQPRRPDALGARVLQKRPNHLCLAGPKPGPRRCREWPAGAASGSPNHHGPHSYEIAAREPCGRPEMLFPTRLEVKQFKILKEWHRSDFPR